MRETPAAANPLSRHIRETLVLAGPVIVARFGIVTMTTLGVLVLGRVATGELAAYVLGGTLFESLIAVIAGLLLGIPILTAQARGAGRSADCGAVWRRGMRYAALVGAIGAAVVQGAEPFYLATGQAPELARAAGRVTEVLGLALVPVACLFASTSFLEALQRPVPGMIAMIAGNITSVLLNLALVPQFGARGAAWTAVANFTLLAVALSLYVRYGLADRAALGLDRPARGQRQEAAAQRRYGYAAALSYGFEAGAFSILTLFAGLLGAVAMAAHGIVYQFLVLAFMVALALATATQVRVGTAWGAGDRAAMARAGWTGLGLAAVFAASLLVLYASIPAPLVGLFTGDAPVPGLATAVLPWIALALLFDGGQSVMNQACRGLGDTWIPTFIQFGVYFGLMLPLAFWLAFRVGHGLAGLYEGIVAASVVSLGMLAARFQRLSRALPAQS